MPERRHERYITQEQKERIEPQTAIDAVLELIAQRGRETAQEFLLSLSSAVEQGRVPDREELLERVREKPTRDEFSDFVRTRLQRRGALQSLADEIDEVDSDLLPECFSKKILLDPKDVRLYQSEFAQTLHSVMAHTFAERGSS